MPRAITPFPATMSEVFNICIVYWIISPVLTVDVKVKVKLDFADNIKYFLHETDEDLSINGGQGYSHQVHAIACAMVEAKALKRTLILPNKLFLIGMHSFKDHDRFARPIDTIFNLTRLQQYVPILFTENPNLLVKALVMKENMVQMVVKKTIFEESLVPYANVDIITRPHIGEYENWSHACARQAHQDRNMPSMQAEGQLLLEAIRPIDSTLALARKISQRIGDNACTLHVRRGDRMQKHPLLDEQTRPDVIFERIKDKCPPGKTLYIGSNENTPGFFDPLKKQYKLYTYRDFVDILEPAGAVQKQKDGTIVVVDNFLLYQVEVSVMLEGRPFVDTFCGLYQNKGGHHEQCRQEAWFGKNAGMYGFDTESQGYRAALGLMGG